MLSRWIRRSGIGQILAPDPNVLEEESKAERNEFTGGIWSFVAPDPNFMSPAQQIKEDCNGDDCDMVECIYCHSKTPVTRIDKSDDTERSALAPRLHANTPSNLQTPFSSPIFSPTGKALDPELVSNVMTATLGAAESMSSPEAVWSTIKTFCTMCASSKDLNEKKLKKLKRMLIKDPSLATARASHMFELADNGYTALMCAASAGNMGVVQLLSDFTIVDDTGTVQYPVDLNATDIQGATALHIASRKGHVDIVKFLREKMTSRNGVDPIGYHAPTDILGKTPYGYAVTSRESKARLNKSELSNTLFSPGDKSVYGVPTPAQTRTGGTAFNLLGVQRAQMDLSYGFAEKEGHRVIQEDAMCHQFPVEIIGAKNSHIGFFGVFDGHGDGGIASRFVSQHIVDFFLSAPELQSPDTDVEILCNALTSACNMVDVALKAKIEGGNAVINGGSTGIVALVSDSHIIVGNVGDSRCILVQNSVSSREAEDQDETDGVINVIQGLSLEDGICSAKPLSIDHKPSIPSEKARIENAGLTVIDETFHDANGALITISKIKKSENNMVAMSRAFGDFDYKDERLPPENRAIVCIPEITVHTRTNDDRFLILACDGVYDVMSNTEIGNFVSKKVATLSIAKYDSKSILAEVCDELLEECLERNAHDNMSVMIIHLPQAQIDSPTRALNFADV